MVRRNLPTLTAVAAVVAALTFVTAAPAGANHADPVVVDVDNGDFFFDSDPEDGVCLGDTDDFNEGEALRHWHAGVPFVFQEGQGGWGCLGGPQAWEVEVPVDHVATVTGRIKYTWDQNVGGGGGNDVHLHVYETVDLLGLDVLVQSTVITDGQDPVTNNDLVKEHPIDFTLVAGSYRLEEDVWSGSHTAWLTRLTVSVDPVA